MANGFDRFNKMWASGGLLNNPSDAQAASGYSYIGPVPPSVEQFNAIEQWGDEKDNWLFDQIARVILDGGDVAVDGDPDQLLNAIYKIGRKRLQANLEMYVTMTGADTNDGLSPATAKRTIQSAVDYLNRDIDFGGYTVNVNVADGTYVGFSVGSMLGQANITDLNFIGNAATPTNCVLNGRGPDFAGAVVYSSNAEFTLSGFQITTNNCPDGIFLAGGGAFVVLDGPIDFGPCLSAHMYAASGGFIAVQSTYNISGNGVFHMRVSEGGSFYTLNMAPGSAITQTNGPHDFYSFVFATSGGNLTINLAFPGTYTGLRYNILENAILITQPGLPSATLPGNSPGLWSYGGIVSGESPGNPGIGPFFAGDVEREPIALPPSSRRV